MNRNLNECGSFYLMFWGLSRGESECVYTVICQSAVSPSYLHQPQAGTTWECLEKMLKSKCLTFFITNYFNKNCSTSIQCHKNINRKLFNLLLKELQRTVTVWGCSHITPALFGVSGHPWWCCKHWSAFALTLGTLYIDDIICERLQSWNNNFFQHILFQWSKVNVDISHFLAVTKGIIMNISHIWCQTMLELGWFLCLLWIFIRHQLFDEPWSLRSAFVSILTDPALL